jgi:hypothetical protein
MSHLFVVLTLGFGFLAAATWLGVAELKHAHPPTGQFVDVPGGRLHVALLGLAHDAPGADRRSSSSTERAEIWRICVSHSAKNSPPRTV